jgi:hypothetical protein
MRKMFTILGLLALGGCSGLGGLGGIQAQGCIAGATNSISSAVTGPTTPAPQASGTLTYTGHMAFCAW